jgi:hypothetical protein
MSQASSASDRDVQPKSIYLVAFPKIVFLYPTMIAALIAGIYMSVVPLTEPRAAPSVEAAAGETARASAVVDRSDAHIVSAAFLLVLMLNLIVFAFDFPRTTSLTLFFAITAVVMGVLVFFSFKRDILPALTALLHAFLPLANATFYFSVFGMIAAILLAVFVNVQFDYWEIAPNELLHHHGFLSNLERFAAPSLKIDKEINDIFEFFLLRSGRLILHPSNEPRAFVLDNVMGITRKEQQLTKMLGALQVQVRAPQAME